MSAAPVIPAKGGIQSQGLRLRDTRLDSRFRGNDSPRELAGVQ